MDFPRLKCWSFGYTCEDGRCSLEILAPTLEHAERRLKALANATSEGEIIHVASSNEETRQLSA